VICLDLFTYDSRNKNNNPAFKLLIFLDASKNPIECLKICNLQRRIHFFVIHGKELEFKEKHDFFPFQYSSFFLSFSVNSNLFAFLQLSVALCDNMANQFYNMSVRF
jgi:hypothetical protein